ncbi:MAG: cytochrome c3 family protein, partial [Myxococcota bacterium]|nr:cytochrome c3 family protein [Myxococcota bacterium]
MRVALRTCLSASLLLVFATTSASAQQRSRMHPGVAVLDAHGSSVLTSGLPGEATTTCGKCHDALYIESHSTHVTATSRVDCFDCHVEDTKKWTPEAFDEDGLLRSEMSGIGPATDAQCGRCHGLVSGATPPVSLPRDYTAKDEKSSSGFRYDASLTTGVVFSGQWISRSYVNLEDRETLTFPWDVHAERLVGCASCHSSPNHPGRVGGHRTQPAHLSRDPRRTTVSAYLEHPDHRLTRGQCGMCHDPSASHSFLPHKERHFEVLSCQGCHVPRVFAPSVSYSDVTVVDENGEPLLGLRGIKESGEPLGGSLLRGMAPLLAPYLTEDGAVKVGPFNLMARFEWLDAERKPVS